MELDLDAQFMIFEITYHMNAYFRKLIIDFYLDLLFTTRFDKCIKWDIF